jgi:hypothetical protein
MGKSDVLDRDEVEGVLSGSFYAPPSETRLRSDGAAQEKEKPTHYKVICISMYTKDLDRLDELVGELKSRGNTKASRSALIRAALEQVDLTKVPRGI